MCCWRVMRRVLKHAPHLVKILAAVCSALFSYVQTCGFVSPFPVFVVDVCSERC